MSEIKLIEMEIFLNPEETFKLFTITDGEGNFSLAHDDSIWWSDEENKYLLKIGGIEGNPKERYKGDPLYAIVRSEEKFYIYETNIFEKILGPYDILEDLIKVIYEDNILGSKIKYLDFETE